MNKSFVLLDKNNNLQKNATIIVRFSFEGNDYLVYSIDENEQNSQIFVSKFILNSEGKYFIDNVLTDEKGKLNNIVYNIVILVPSDAQKGNSFATLSAGLSEKFSVKLSLDIPTMDVQEYYNNCSVAITSKVLVDSAVKLYSENLSVVSASEPAVVPTWTAPVEVTSPSPVEAQSVNSQLSSIPEPAPVILPVQDTVSSVNVENSAVIEPVVNSVSEQVTAQPSVTTPTPVVASTPTQNVEIPNPQLEKLAVVSDPSLGIGVQQPNGLDNKKAGFANTKYIVAGSVCLVLSIAVVLVSYILISNM